MSAYIRSKAKAFPVSKCVDLASIGVCTFVALRWGADLVLLTLVN